LAQLFDLIFRKGAKLDLGRPLLGGVVAEGGEAFDECVSRVKRLVKFEFY
jgi:hypothetical protein